MGHLLPDKQLAWLPMVSVLHQAPKRERKGREKGREWKRTDRGRMTAEASNGDKEEQERGSTERKEQVRAHVRDGAGASESRKVCGKWWCVCNKVWERVCVRKTASVCAYGRDQS